MIDKLLNPLLRQKRTQSHYHTFPKSPNAQTWTINQVHIQSPKFKYHQQINPQTKSPKKIEDYISETPAFQYRFDRGVDFIDGESEKYMLDIGGNLSESENKSQVISIHEIGEDFHPVLMSSINQNLKRNFKRLLQTKIHNNVEELRIIQSDFLTFISQQRSYFQSCLQNLGKELSQISKKAKVALGSTSTELMQELLQKKKLITSLQTTVQQKNQENAQLKKDLGDNKKILEREQQKSKQLRNINSKMIVSHQSQSSLYESNFCSNCKVLQVKNNALKDQILKDQKEIQALLISNQKLQEYIFDIEQKIVGIDIEVQKRLSEQLKTYKNFTLPSFFKSSEGHQKQDYLEILRKLNDENTALQQKCEQLQKNCLKEHQLQQFQKDLNEKNTNYHRKEIEFFQSLAKHEKQKQSLYQKQHQVMTKQEKIAIKIEELQKKQSELNQWESMLASQKAYPLPSIDRHKDMEKVRIDELYNNSFGKIQDKIGENGFNFASGFLRSHRDETINTMERVYSHNNTFIPELPLHRDDDANYYEKYSENRAGKDSPSSPPSKIVGKQKGSDVYMNILKKQEKAPNKYLSYKNEKETKEKLGTSFGLSPSNYRESSKNSRMSPKRSIRGVYLQNTSANYEKPSPKERQHTHNLGSKLDKLRQQIKREIQSIK